MDRRNFLRTAGTGLLSIFALPFLGIVREKQPGGTVAWQNHLTELEDWRIGQIGEPYPFSHDLYGVDWTPQTDADGKLVVAGPDKGAARIAKFDRQSALRIAKIVWEKHGFFAQVLELGARPGFYGVSATDHRKGNAIIHFIVFDEHGRLVRELNGDVVPEFLRRRGPFVTIVERI